jgi:hypothetical protein
MKKLEKLKNFICNYYEDIFKVIVLIGFFILVYIGLKESYVYLAIYTLIITIYVAYSYSDEHALGLLVFAIIIILIAHSFFYIAKDFDNYYETTSEKKIKLLEKGIILFDDLTTLEDRQLYYSCLEFNCTHIVTSKYTKGFKGYNDIFNKSQTSLAPIKKN